MEIRFSQTACGEHFIQTTDADGTKAEVCIAVNELSIDQMRELINGLGNILSSVSAAMFKYGEGGR